MVWELSCLYGKKEVCLVRTKTKCTNDKQLFKQIKQTQNNMFISEL